MAHTTFTPPFPPPLARKPGLARRFWLGCHSWVHTLFAGAYTMKLGETRLPRFKIFMVNELPLVHRVLGQKGDAFPKHGLLDDMLGPLVGSSLFSANGDAWRRQRAMLAPAFAHTNLARAFPVMMAACDDLIARLAQVDGVVTIDPYMTQVTADIIFRTLFSVSLGADEAARIHAAFARYQSHAQRSAVLGLYRLPRLGFAGRAAAAARDIRAVFAPIVRARMAIRRDGAAGGFDDILETMMAARDPDTGAPFGEEELVDQIAVLFLAGHETSASALSWALYLLASCPDWQRKVRGSLGEGPIDMASLKGMEALRNVFRETLRLYPPVSFMPRQSAQGETLRGKSVGPRDLLIVAPWLVHRNPDTWACPHAFDPDRFATPEGAQAAREAWIPFGMGPRVCVGAGFAMQEAMVILARMLRAFDLEAVGRPELVSRLTLRARGGIGLRLRPVRSDAAQA